MNGAPTQVDLYNTNTQPVNDVTYNAVWANDTWKVTDRLTVNLGLRFEAYQDGWGDQDLSANGHPQLADWPADYRPAERQRYFDFIAPRTVGAVTVADTKTLSPRVGFAYDLTGDNRTVLKAYFGQSRFNSADLLADQENPVGLAQLRYGFVPCTATLTTQCDLNGNGLLDGPQELGAFNSTQGGGGFVRVDRDLVRPVANELSVNLEREIRGGLSGRASYVYKNQRDLWGEYDTLRGPLYTVPYTINDPGPDNNPATLEDNQTLQTFDRPAGALPQDRVFTNVGDADADFHTVEFAVNRRFTDNWMVLTSAGYTWATMLHDVTGYQQLLNQQVNTANQNYLPGRRIFGDNGNETSTTWNYKIIGRYVMPYEIGVSGSWRVQSGQNFGRTLGINFPGDGNRTFRVEPIDARRFPNVSLLDLRLDKSFRFGQYGRLTGQFDVFNLLNSGVPINFRQTTANFLEVTEILAPRVIRVGVRYDF